MKAVVVRVMEKDKGKRDATRMGIGDTPRAGNKGKRVKVE